MNILYGSLFFAGIEVLAYKVQVSGLGMRDPGQSQLLEQAVLAGSAEIIA